MQIGLLLVGVVLVLLGAVGVSGRLDRARFSVYQQHGERPEPRVHRRLQRVGGAVMVVGGLVFLARGLGAL